MFRESFSLDWLFVEPVEVFFLHRFKHPLLSNCSGRRSKKQLMEQFRVGLRAVSLNVKVTVPTKKNRR